MARIKINLPDGRSGYLNIPDDVSNEQLASSLSKAMGRAVDPSIVTSIRERMGQTKEQSLANRASQTLGTGAQIGMEALSLPFELAGESIRLPVEYGFNAPPPGEGFRAPSLFQRMDPSLKTKEPPSIGFNVVNKLLRAGAAFGSRLPEGIDAAQNAALQAYQSDRGLMGAAEDTALSLLAGRVPLPGAGMSVVEAPYRATGEAIKKTGQALGSGAKATGKGAIRTIFGPTPEQQSTYYRRPGAVRASRNVDDLADEVAGTANELAKRVERLDNVAWNRLLRLNSEPRSKIISALRRAKAEFAGKGNIGDADKAAVNQIDKYIDAIEQIGQKGVGKGVDPMLTQQDLRRIVQSIRRDATYGVPGAEPVNRAVQSAAKRLDSILKENGNYKEVMEDFLAPATRTLKDMVKKFNLKTEPGKGYVAKDATASKLNALKGARLDKKPETKQLLTNVKKQTGRDFADDVKLLETKEALTAADRSRGSRRTLLGAVAGSAAEPMIPGYGLGPAIGGALGATADVYGGPAAKGIINLLRASSRVGQAGASVMGRNPSVEALVDIISRGGMAPVVAATR